MVISRKLDNRIYQVIQSSVKHGHRGIFVMVGEKSRDQVVILHHLLSKTSTTGRPSVLWCYKQDLGFTTHKKKRMKMLKKKIKAGTLDPNTSDTFDMFISATNIRYLYYAESHNILGNTYGMCVLQDFEAVTPNVLARTIETVSGGGLVVIMLNTISDIKQFYNLQMDCHSKYTTHAYHHVVPRFNKRFLLSLTDCGNCLVVSDNLDVLPITTKSAISKAPSTEEADMELKELKLSFCETQPIGSVLEVCKTIDQANCLVKFVDVISEKTLKSIITLTSGRGRGKSAALGLAIATSIAFGYTNVFVTSPSPENLKTLFEFVLKGFDVLGYAEHTDYELIQSTDESKSVVRINVYKDHRQTVQYIKPDEGGKLIGAELLVIDEAGAIPLPLVKGLIGPYLVLLSSTIHGYEGTGRSLSLKLIQELRQQSNSVGGVTLTELKLEQPIRYRDNDPVEGWLNNLLCLDATNVHRIISGCPTPQECSLYFVNRDLLFSYHKASEIFLQRIMSLYVSSHYKNTPNDLQLLSDAPAHQILCLLGPFDKSSTKLPEVLCVIQICYEGEINKEIIMAELSKGKRSAGDLIPWTVSQQFQDSNFGSLSGARIVRIATHPDYQSMGYGKQAIKLLQQYYQGMFTTDMDSESKKPDSLLINLADRKPEPLQYLGVSYGLTQPLLKFWNRLGFVTVYLRQTSNEMTGEHTAIMLNLLEEPSTSNAWLQDYHKDFKVRLLNLLGYDFRSLSPQLILSLISPSSAQKQENLSCERMEEHLSRYDLRRLQSYTNNLTDYHLILDMIPTLARLYFRNHIQISLSPLQAAILLALGLQYKRIDELSAQFGALEGSQILGIFKKIVKKLVTCVEDIFKSNIVMKHENVADKQFTPMSTTLTEELASAEKEFKIKHEENKNKLEMEGIGEYTIKSNESVWKDALDDVKVGDNTIVSVKRAVKPLGEEGEEKKKKKKRKTNEFKTKTKK